MEQDAKKALEALLAIQEMIGVLESIKRDIPLHNIDLRLFANSTRRKVETASLELAKLTAKH